MVRLACLLLFTLLPLLAGSVGSRVEYIGGTLEMVQKCDAAISSVDDQVLSVSLKRTKLTVPYDHINLVEYGQKVQREYVAAVLISPLFLLAKKRQHFLTIGFTDDNGKQQAMVFRVGKHDIRTVLVTLEARTGRKVVYQDEEARKAGKG